MAGLVLPQALFYGSRQVGMPIFSELFARISAISYFGPGRTPVFSGAESLIFSSAPLEVFGNLASTFMSPLQADAMIHHVVRTMQSGAGAGYGEFRA